MESRWFDDEFPSFKGLEADAVALVDLDDIASDRSRYALYVGTSRARVLFAVLIAESQRELYTGRAGEFGRELKETEQAASDRGTSTRAARPTRAS